MASFTQNPTPGSGFEFTPAGAPAVWWLIPKGPSLPAHAIRGYTLLRHALLSPHLQRYLTWQQRIATLICSLMGNDERPQTKPNGGYVCATNCGPRIDCMRLPAEGSALLNVGRDADLEAQVRATTLDAHTPIRRLKGRGP